LLSGYRDDVATLPEVTLDHVGVRAAVLRHRGQLFLHLEAERCVEILERFAFAPFPEYRVGGREDRPQRQAREEL
jgi:hypothetical protein